LPNKESLQPGNGPNFWSCRETKPGAVLFTALSPEATLPPALWLTRRITPASPDTWGAGGKRVGLHPVGEKLLPEFNNIGRKNIEWPFKQKQNA
jgi:hypothetical protein